MNNTTVFDYILTEKENFKTVRVPLTNSKDWNMREHIERCTNVANGWFHSGKNDGIRPYNDIVTPIVDVAFRSEGFDVKDIVPYVDNINFAYKSFLIKKFHPQWARKHELDTFIDEVVESSVIYDLVLIKNINNVRPEVVPLQQIAFCDQTDVLAGSVCLLHQYSPSELIKFKSKWDSKKIDNIITLAGNSKTNLIANGKEVKTPGKYIEIYELHGEFPEIWLNDTGDKDKYIPQLHIVGFYTDDKGEKQGITLFKGKNKPIGDTFKALKIDTVRSYGRACGRSVVERLFEPQVWNNYAGIKLKELLDSAINIFQTSSDEYGNQKLSDIKPNTILKHETNKPITKIDGTLQNLGAYQNYQIQTENNARILGSASDAQLGTNPVSGTPFALQSLIVQQGQGIHEYRQGKIATFFADVLYRDWILKFLVSDMNKGQKFSEELSFDELQEISKIIATNVAEKEIKNKILKGEKIEESDRESLITLHMESFKQNGSRGFFEVMQKEFEDIPVAVMVNIKGKQKNMVQNADKLSNIISQVMRNPQAFNSIPGLAKTFNELLENSGLSPIDFAKITSPVPTYKEIETPTVAPPEEAVVENLKK